MSGKEPPVRVHEDGSITFIRTDKQDAKSDKFFVEIKELCTPDDEYILQLHKNRIQSPEDETAWAFWGFAIKFDAPPDITDDIILKVNTRFPFLKK